VEIGTEAAQLLFWEYINSKFFAVYTGIPLFIQTIREPFFLDVRVVQYIFNSKPRLSLAALS
jgi:hypothetical protein